MKNNLKNESINNSIDILELAIKKNVSASKASTLAGFGRNYVSNTKLSLNEKLEAKTATKKDIIAFNKMYRQYEKSLM